MTKFSVCAHTMACDQGYTCALLVEGQKTIVWGQFFLLPWHEFSESASVHQAMHRQFCLLSHFPSPSLVYMLLLHFYILFYMCYHMCNVVHAGRSRDSLQQSVLSFYHVGPRNQIQLSDLAASLSAQSAISLVPVPVFNRWVAVIVAFSFVV